MPLGLTFTGGATEARRPACLSLSSLDVDGTVTGLCCVLARCHVGNQQATNHSAACTKRRGLRYQVPTPTGSGRPEVLMDEYSAMAMAARLNMIESIVADLLLNAIIRTHDPTRSLAEIREATLQKINSEAAKLRDTNDEHANIRKRALSETAAFAERFFDLLSADVLTSLAPTPLGRRDTLLNKWIHQIRHATDSSSQYPAHMRAVFSSASQILRWSEHSRAAWLSASTLAARVRKAASSYWYTSLMSGRRPAGPPSRRWGSTRKRCDESDIPSRSR